jgi:hypothetical protein
MADKDDDNFQQDPSDDIYISPDDGDSLKTSPDEDPPFTQPKNTSRKRINSEDQRTDYKTDNDRQERYDAGETDATDVDKWEEDDQDYEKPVDRY